MIYRAFLRKASDENQNKKYLKERKKNDNEGLGNESQRKPQ